MTDNVYLALIIKKYEVYFFSLWKEQLGQSLQISVEEEYFCLQKSYSTLNQRLDKIQYVAGKVGQIPGGIGIMF